MDVILRGPVRAVPSAPAALPLTLVHSLAHAALTPATATGVTSQTIPATHSLLCSALHVKKKIILFLIHRENVLSL